MARRSVVAPLFKKMFGFLTSKPSQDMRVQPMLGDRPACLPPERRVYAVGDIHGRHDLLVRIEELIAQDLAAHPPAGPVDIVHLGDYVDRGPSSRQVIEHLVRRPFMGATVHCLLGNHDAWFRHVLIEPGVDEDWWRHGGHATVNSYGLDDYYLPPAGPARESWRARLRRHVPASHRLFLQELPVAWQLGDYFFCHAGVHPGVELAMQRQEDLIWIRQAFLRHQGSFGAVIVHGHTIEEQPVVKTNRIGIDTGAVQTGRLTALVLEEATQRFLSTEPA